MRKALIPLAVAVVAAVMALGTVLPVSASDSTSLTLNLIIDGGDTAQDVGDVTITYDGAGTFTVDYTITDPNWALVETHVYLDTSAPTKSAPGKFAYAGGETISLTVGSGDTVYIAAHAELQMIDANGDPILDPETGLPIEETGWAQSPDLPNNPIPPGKNWATYVEWVPVP